MGDENPNAMNLGFNPIITRVSSENHERGSENLEGRLRLSNPSDRLTEELGQGRQPGNHVEVGEMPVYGIGITPFVHSSQLFNNKETLVKKNVEEKCSADALGFFDCRICLDLAKDPVVTCCGHLFCWHCIYRWLNFQSAASKGCPVCKGKVSTKSVTPILGHLGNTVQSPKIFNDLKIPPRPLARRVESWKEAFQKTVFPVPMEEIVQRLGCKIDWNAVHPQDIADSLAQLLFEKNNQQLNRILTSRGMRREQNYILAPNGAVDIAPSGPTDSHTGGNRINSALSPGSNSNGAGRFSLIGSDFPDDPADRIPEQQLHFLVDDDDDEDRDDFSSIAADMHSDQTLESVIEVDSGTNTSSDGALTDSDVGDEYSRPLRRRRLN